MRLAACQAAPCSAGVRQTAPDGFTKEIFAEGFRDLHEEFGRKGVYVSTQQLDASDGFEGAVTLCLDMPDDVLAQYDVTDDLQKASGYHIALVPAEVLHGLGKPAVYDHEWAGPNRRDLVQAIRRLEQPLKSGETPQGIDWERDESGEIYSWMKPDQEGATPE
jgi:hypothetical protein